MTTPTTLSLSLGTCMAWVLVLSVRTQLLCMKLSMLTVLHGAVKLMFRVCSPAEECQYPARPGLHSQDCRCW